MEFYKLNLKLCDKKACMFYCINFINYSKFNEGKIYVINISTCTILPLQHNGNKTLISSE